MTQIRGDIDVGTTGPDRIEHAVAGSPDHRHPSHQGIGRTCHPDPARGLREHRAQLLHELAQRLGAGERTDPTTAQTAQAVNDLQGSDVDQGARAGKGITHAG